MQQSVKMSMIQKGACEQTAGICLELENLRLKVFPYFEDINKLYIAQQKIDQAVTTLQQNANSAVPQIIWVCTHFMYLESLQNSPE